MTDIILPKWLLLSLGIVFIAGVVFLFNANRVSTGSMNPTLMLGDISVTNRFENPNVGDIISFDCVDTSKCGVSIMTGVIHRLVAVEPNGCMHIEGDNQPSAFDTRDYGCLMPSEISIVGVVHPLISWNNLFNR